MNYGPDTFALLGNHDWGIWSHGGDEGSRYKLNLALNQIRACYDRSERSSGWNMPYRYYHFTTEYAEFYCIDSTSYYYDAQQQAWLAQVFQKQQLAHPEKWQILVSHHPLLAIGKRNLVNGKKDWSLYEQFFHPGKKTGKISYNEVLYSQLKDYPFDIIISAHDHALAGYVFELNDQRRAFQLVSGAGGAKLEKMHKYTSCYGQLQREHDLQIKVVGEDHGSGDQHGYVSMNIAADNVDLIYRWVNGREANTSIYKHFCRSPSRLRGSSMSEEEIGLEYRDRNHSLSLP
ncbi:hypothetical protein BGC07_11185 [Piscirickettsia litoralis]|uniref:Calcineurin-like phosphoesterase domain-containing protein n=1 Tax=Piscirickettsia litoralis TaxID=1891921 RepID=A0ABX3A780_9GAMM|nr:hypothetical protein BGC07_11185 [Piscirickettsia litoralis]